MLVFFSLLFSSVLQYFSRFFYWFKCWTTVIETARSNKENVELKNSWITFLNETWLLKNIQKVSGSWWNFEVINVIWLQNSISQFEIQVSLLDLS